MNSYRRLAALSLLTAMLLLIVPALAAPVIRVYIPETALPLSLPALPQTPQLTGSGLSEDGAFWEVSLTAPADSVTLLSGQTEQVMTLSADGLSAVCPVPVVPDGFIAVFGDVSVRYAASGSVRSVDLREQTDRFDTGQADPVTIIRWECAVLKTASAPYLIWHISSLTAEYRADSYITKVLVHYQADQAMSVVDYEITYAPAAGEAYLIRYGKADHVVSGEYTDGQVRLVNGSGRHFWDNTWYDAVTGRQSSKSGLLAFTSFDSPRVKVK